MDYVEILQEMLFFIDAHIKEKLDVEILAKRAGFSPYHFCRIFQMESGYSLMEYVKHRRLVCAAAEFGSGRRIADIAADYGFETHSGFSKAFRRNFGCSPEVYRAHAVFDVPKTPVFQNMKNYILHGFIKVPHIMARKSMFTLAGYAITTSAKDGENLKEISQFRDDCTTDGRQEKLNNEPFVKNHAVYGARFFDDPENDESVYVFGVEAKDGHDIPSAYHVRSIPESLYAVFATPPGDEENFAERIKDTWNYIFSEGLPNSGYEFDNNGVAFERYDERSFSRTDRFCDIYIPVIKILF